MPELKVAAIRFIQNRRVFYVATIQARDLISRAKVDVWSAEDSPEIAGYQRAPNPSRLREIANYVHSTDAILPEGGFANARAPQGSGSDAYGTILPFEPIGAPNGDIQPGLLTLPKNKPLFLVDMQHRLLGLKTAIEDDARSDLASFPLVVTIADGLKRLEEVGQFELINTAQKKVRTDLARRLMSLQAEGPDQRRAYDRAGKLWEARGPVVCQYLNTTSGVWKNRILPPNKSKKDFTTALVPETSFVTSLKPILQTAFCSRLPEEQCAQLIAAYWDAISDLWPEALANPDGHLIQKTPGIFPLHALAPEIIELVRSKKLDLNRQNLGAELKPIAHLGGSEYWERGNIEGAGQYGSMKGFKMLESEMRSFLPQLTLNH